MGAGGGGPSGTPGGSQSSAPPTVAGRQWTSQQLLRWDWDSGFLSPTDGQGAALTEDEALGVLADGDPRPLLVLRECESCAGTEDAFLSRELDNEKTVLLGRWFHAVRFPQGVTDPDHPLHALFADKSPPHLFTVTADGKTRVDLDGRQSQAQLWKAMTTVLRKAYRKDPEAARKALANLLDKLDGLDSRQADLEERLLDVRAGGKDQDSPQVKDLEAKLAEVVAERQALLEEGRAIDDLELRET